MYFEPYGEVVSSHFEIFHTEKELSELTNMILRFDDVRVVMEYTGVYYKPVLDYLQSQSAGSRSCSSIA
jgi:transposase